MLLAEIWDVLERRVFPIPSTDRLFNPYRDGAPDLDREDAPAIRRENVRAYLAAYDTMPDVLLLAEAPGPWGCRFSGVPITCEAQLLDPAFPIDGRKTSLASDPHTEYCAGIHWRVLADHFPRFITWNAVPFHPHRPGEPLSIRTPTAREIDAFTDVVDAFLSVIQPKQVVAVGRKGEHSLNRLGVENTYVRHPSQGGAKRFERGVLDVLRACGI